MQSLPDRAARLFQIPCHNDSQAYATSCLSLHSRRQATKRPRILHASLACVTAFGRPGDVRLLSVLARRAGGRVWRAVKRRMIVGTYRA